MTDEQGAATGDGSTESVLERTRAADWRTRADAAAALRAFLPDDRAVAARLVELLDDDDLAVVQEAAETLVLTGAEDDLDAVLDVLHHGPDDVGDAVQGSFSRLVDDAGVRERLAQRLEGERAEVVRGLATSLGLRLWGAAERAVRTPTGAARPGPGPVR